MLIRYGGLIANYHRGFTPNSRLVIWLSGMPSIPSDTSDNQVSHFLASGCDIVFPEYYGYGRSDSEFTPQGCIDTLIDTYNFFTQGGIVQDIWTQQEVEFSGYEEIVLVGSSFGGAWIARSSHLLPEVKAVGLINPALEYADLGKIEYPEESWEDAMKIMNQGGYGHMYRSATSEDRDAFYQDQRGQPYDEMIQDLSTKDVFIVHGDADECVHVGRSRKLYQQLQAINPSGNHRYLEISKGGHGGVTKQIGVIEFCKWLNGR